MPSVVASETFPHEMTAAVNLLNHREHDADALDFGILRGISGRFFNGDPALKPVFTAFVGV
jgi:hypothetical protein